MKRFAIALLLMSAIPCVARMEEPTNTSTNAGCPLKITADFRPSRQHSIQYDLVVNYWNQTEKAVIGEALALDIMDSVGDWTEYPQGMAASDKIKAHSRSYNNWDVYPNAVGGYRVYVKKVAFSDGTTWEDDGSKKCMYSRDIRER